MGEVTKGTRLTQAEAIVERQSGRDVVVCGTNLSANMRLAQQIEGAATGAKFLFHAAHASAGPHALSHFQPRVRPPHGHTFFESPPHRTAK
jgi:hypothetical protein